MANTVHKIIRFLRKNLTNSSYNEALSAVNEKVGSGLEAGEPVIAFYQNGDTKGVVMGISDGANSGNGFTFHNAEIIESKLSTKVDKTAGQGLSTNDYSNDEKKKVNSSIKSISTTGGSNSSTTTFTKNDSSTIKNTVSGNGVTVSVTGTNGEYITTLGVASATTNTIGGIKVGYIQNNKNYPVLLDSSSEKAYVNVPWENNTHYASNSILADSNTATANTTTDLTNGKVRINHIENGKVTSSAIIKGTGSTIVTASTDGTITISSSTPDLSTYATQTWVTDKGYTTNKGTVTSVAVKMNGNVKGTITSSGTIDLGNVITDISGKSDTGHTHTTSLAETTNAANITFEHGKNYQITAGGTSGIFKMPSLPTADSSTSGVMKLYTVTGKTNDGAMSQSAVTTALAGKSDTIHKHVISDINDFPSSLKNPSSLIIKLNGGDTEGTSRFTYDGSNAKTVNITKSDLGLGNVDNTADANKSVKYATTAGSANAVTWNNVTGKPSEFTPASHTHEYLPLSGGTVSGDVTFKDSKVVQLNTLKVPTAAGGSTYGAGTSGQVLKTNGTTVYWGNDNNTVYTHPTTSGNKHIPSGGSSGQILRWSADGTAVWGSDSDTHYESKTVVNNSTASTANTTTALANGMVYLNHVENGSVKTSHSISGGGATTVTTNEKGDIVISSTDTNTDTKNTAGSTNTSSKIFLIGATSQATNPQTYSHDTCYVGTDGCLYSNNTKVITSIPTATTTSLGAVKVGSNITVNSGTISVSKSNVTNALGYTPSNVITIIDLT